MSDRERQREPVPDWWAEEYHRRQVRCRAAILAQLRREGRVGSMWGLNCTNYCRREKEAALAALVAAGQVVVEETTEPIDRTHRATVVRRYYRLSEEATRV